MRNRLLVIAAMLITSGGRAGGQVPSDVGKLKDLGIEDLLEVKAVSAVRHASASSILRDPRR